MRDDVRPERTTCFRCATFDFGRQTVSSSDCGEGVKSILVLFSLVVSQHLVFCCEGVFLSPLRSSSQGFLLPRGWLGVGQEDCISVWFRSTCLMRADGRSDRNSQPGCGQPFDCDATLTRAGFDNYKKNGGERFEAKFFSEESLLSSNRAASSTRLS